MVLGNMSIRLATSLSLRQNLLYLSPQLARNRLVDRCRTIQFKSGGRDLSHVDAIKNMPRMVDISEKSETMRSAHAQAIVKLPLHVMEMLDVSRDEGGNRRDIQGAKGPVFATAIVAGVMAAKRTAELVPFCHQVPLEKCDIEIGFLFSGDRCSVEEQGNEIKIDCYVSTSGKTGVEMEAIVGASSAAICIYDMLKALSHDIEITNTFLVSKSGGKSTYKRSS